MNSLFRVSHTARRLAGIDLPDLNSCEYISIQRLSLFQLLDTLHRRFNEPGDHELFDRGYKRLVNGVG